MATMKTKETREWPAPPARGKYRNASAPAKPAAPRPEDFDTDRQYRAAYTEWWRKSEGLPKERTRVLDKDGAHEREAGLIPASGYLTRYERNAALAQQQDARASLLDPRVTDVTAYYRRHGHTPDGRTPLFNSAAYERAAEAMAARLRGDLPPADDD